MRTGLWLAILGMSVVGCNPPIDISDQSCEDDADGDGTVDCQDPDDDDDGLTDDDEATLGTDRRDADTDRDGLSDLVEADTDREVNTGGGTTVETLRTDPLVPSLLVEADFMTGFRPTEATIGLALEAFDGAGLEVYFRIDDAAPITPTSPLTSALDIETLLSAAQDRADHVHVVFADEGAGEHGHAHFLVPNDPGLGNHGDDPDASRAGGVVFLGTIATDRSTFSTELDAVSVTADGLAARALVHTVGRLIGMTNEGPDGGIALSNAMISEADLGDLGTNAADWSSAVRGGGAEHPVIAADSLAQIDLRHKASVELATDPTDRRFDMGTDASPIEPGYFRVTTTSLFDDGRAWGFDEPAPTVAAQQGSSSLDARTADYVQGDPGELGPTSFRIRGMGAGPAFVFLRLGAQVSADTQVRCELSHPTQGVAFLEGQLSTSNLSLQTSGSGMFVYPVLDENEAGFGTGELVLTCINDDTRADAPIEYVTFTKLGP